MTLQTGRPTQIVDTTGFAATIMRDPAGRPSLIRAVILKATFDLTNEQAWAPAKKQRDFQADTPHMDDLGRSLAWPTDFVLNKPRPDLLVHGAFHQPQGIAAATGRAAIEFGTLLRKELAVFGPRRAARLPDGAWMITPPEPMTTVPLRWEMAFGGLTDPANPLGRGRTPDTKGIVQMPQLEDPVRPVKTPTDAAPPANFAAVPPAFPDRRRKWGTRDRQWMWFRAPLPPDDYDPTVHNAAPPDQQLEAWPNGDEPLVLHNLHPKHPVLRTALPGLRPRAGVLRAIGGTKIMAQEVPLRLDTIVVLPDEDQLVLIWRGQVVLEDGKEPEPPMLRLEIEPLAAPPEPFAPGLAARMFAEWQAQQPAPPPPDPPPPPPPPTPELPDISADLKQARELFAKLNMPPALQSLVDNETDPQIIFDAVAKHIEETALAIQRQFGVGPS